MPQCSQSGFHWNQLCPGCSDFCVDCTIFHFLVLILLDFSAALGSVGHLFFLGILYSAGFHSPFSPCTPGTCLCPFGVFSSLPLIDWCFLRLHSCHPTPLSSHNLLSELIYLYSFYHYNYLFKSPPLIVLLSFTVQDQILHKTYLPACFTGISAQYDQSQTHLFSWLPPLSPDCIFRYFRPWLMASAQTSRPKTGEIT